MSPVAADRLTCTTSVEVKIACDASELRTAQQFVSERVVSRHPPGVAEREKVLFYQIPRHTRDGPIRRNLGHVGQ